MSRTSRSIVLFTCTRRHRTIRGLQVRNEPRTQCAQRSVSLMSEINHGRSRPTRAHTLTQPAFLGTRRHLDSHGHLNVTEERKSSRSQRRRQTALASPPFNLYVTTHQSLSSHPRKNLTNYSISNISLYINTCSVFPSRVIIRFII